MVRRIRSNINGRILRVLIMFKSNTLEFAEILSDHTEVARTNGKLLFIQELSNWLLQQPVIINKNEVIEFLLVKAGEPIDE